ncbi:M56 family metallopeptidase [Qiania dongpingensis]|uniref:M56 family metallopeptidase n=1 Tax=Qiania dongpingensis TaxID=2763669 RepID=A0A7G9G559_9FIRM|nr:M56 family metallopeptidase [Qiania dongpingensis]QNM05941.1 M56 family metallopeptidase [Qiania dongpingensis]
MAWTILSSWFFGVFLTSLTGTVSCFFWKLLEFVMEKKKQFRWIVFSGKLVIIFYLVPVIYLYIYFSEMLIANNTYMYTMVVTPVILYSIVAAFLIWFVGFCVGILRYFMQKQNLKLFVSCSVPADLKINRIKDEIEKRLALKQSVAVRFNSQCSVPVVMGVRKPVILLPEQEYDQKKLRIILEHELMHVKHRDLFWKHFLYWISKVHWFNYSFKCLTDDINGWNETYCDRDACYGEMAICTYEEYFDTILENARVKPTEKLLFTMYLYENKKGIKRRMVRMRHYHASKELRKVVVALLTVCFVGVSSVTAFAAGEGMLKGYDALTDTTANKLTEADVTNDVETIIPPGTDIGIIEIEVPARTRTYMDWTIPGDTGYRTGPFWVTKGKKIATSALISPGNKFINLGIIEPDGTRRQVSGMSAVAHTFDVNYTGGYCVFVENRASSEITVQLLYEAQ